MSVAYKAGDGPVVIPSDDGTSFINNAIFDDALRVLKPTTFQVLSLLIVKTRSHPRLETRASLGELATHDGRQVLSRNSVATALRELRDLGMLEIDDTPLGSTAVHTYRLRDVSEWDHAAIEWRLRHRERFRDARSVIRNDPQWLAIRQQVLERDHFTCHYCGQQGGTLHCDHVIPVARGGTNVLSNLVTACERCNLSKNDRTPDEWQPW